jgi:PAS domain S-box-containing protein
MPSQDPRAASDAPSPDDLHSVMEVAFQRAALGMAVVDRERRSVVVNDAMGRLFGYSAEEMRGMSFLRLTHPDDVAIDAHLFAELHEGVRDRYQIDKRYVRGDGTIFWGRLTLSRVRGSEARGYLVGVVEDVTADRKSLRDQEFLVRAGEILASSLDFDTALGEVTRLASTYLADWCAIDELGPDGRVRRVSVAHPDPAKVLLAHDLAERYPPDPDARRGLPEVLRTGKPELVEEIPDEWLVEGAVDEEHLRIARELGLRSYIIVPLIARGTVLGALSLVSAESGRRYGADDLALAEELARRAALALDNARLFGETEAARRAAEEAERGVRDILDGIGDPFVVQDREWRYRYMNDAADEVFRKAGRGGRDALLGKVLWDLYPDLIGSRHETEMRRAQRDRVTVSFEEFYSGAGTWSEIHCYPLANGGLATVWKDVTARKRAEEALHFLAESSTLLGSVLDYEETLRAVARLMVPHLADWCAVDILDEGGKLRQLAVAHVEPDKVKWAEELNRRYPPDPAAPSGVYHVVRTGRPEIYPEIPDQLLVDGAVDEEHLRIARELGLRSAILVPLTASKRTLGVLTLASTEGGRRYSEADLALAMELARRAGFAVENARLYRETDEARLHLEEQAVEMEMQGEELRTQAAQLEEIQTDLEESNEELHAANDRLVEQMARVESLRTQAEDANRAKSDFLAIMSHELRTPLNAMIGYVDLLLAGIPEPIPALAHAQVVRMRGASRHLLQLIEEVLTFTRLEAGRESAEVQDVDLDELLGEVGAIIEPLAAAKHVTFRFPHHVDRGSIRTDPRKLRQILINVLGNAVKFTSEGEVCFEVATEAEQICFRVRDTGVGIAPEDQEVIFEPFRQLDQGKTRGAEGTGLGLAVSRRLAVLLGGGLTVQSEAGAGSTFVLCLPLQSE